MFLVGFSCFMLGIIVGVMVMAIYNIRLILVEEDVEFEELMKNYKDEEDESFTYDCLNDPDINVDLGMSHDQDIPKIN